ncbi:MAG: hypothetical protein P8X55_20250 [Desulfosarcinaceae bacterium]
MSTAYSRNNKGQIERVVLTDDILEQFYGRIYHHSVPELARRTGLPYTLIYNIVNKRVKSIRPREYRMIFSQDPPAQNVKKVDGAFFRQMVQLWLYLHEETSQKELFRELHGLRHSGKVDYRIFSGRTRTVAPDLEEKMKKMFAADGVDEFTLRQWIVAYRSLNRRDRIAYTRIRPILLYLQENLGVHPSSILNQLFDRYESGELKTVSRKVYERALDLKTKTERTSLALRRPVLEKLREQVYGRKTGYTLPTSHRLARFRWLMSLLSARTADLLAQGEGLVLEKKILAPAYDKNEYKNQIHGFTQFDKAPSALGMNKKAFDLMVSSNCEIFREVGRYAERWYLSDLYLKELPRKPHFDLIFKKYELLARKMIRGKMVNECMH